MRTKKVFGLKKQSQLLQSYLPFSESCAVIFGELGLSTLPCLYILEVNKVVYAEQSRTTALERKSSECGVKLINKIPNPNDLKSCIFILKVSNSTETPLFWLIFMECHRQQWKGNLVLVLARPLEQLMVLKHFKHDKFCNLNVM